MSRAHGSRIMRLRPMLSPRARLENSSACNCSELSARARVVKDSRLPEFSTDWTRVLSGWTFHSFSMERFLHYFGHSTPEEIEEMIAAATWEETDSGAKFDLDARSEERRVGKECRARG